MQADELVRLSRKRPFEPFTIHMWDGSSYPVCQPGQMVITRRAVHVGINSRSDLAGAFDDVAICSLVHVTRLTPGADERSAKHS